MPEASPGADRSPRVGTVLTMPGPVSAELAAEPFDLVWIDLEHGALGPRDALEVALGAQATGAEALVRLPVATHAWIAPVLDAGVDGLVLADVRSAAEAAPILELCSYPPAGRRGWGPRRSGLRGRSAAEEPVAPSVWAQIESGQGVERAREIAELPGLDVVCVGTADLSFDLGSPHELDGEGLAEAVRAVHRDAVGAGVELALAGALDRLPADLLDLASILVHGTDARLYAGAVDDAAAWARSQFRRREENQRR